MPPLVVVLFLSVIGLGAGAYLVQWLLLFAAPDAALLKLGGLVRDVTEGFGRRQAATLAALAALFGGALFVAYGLRTPVENDFVGGLEVAVWFLISFLVGVGGALAQGEFGAFLGVRGAVRTAAAAKRNVDAMLRSSFRAGAALSLFSASSSTFALAALVLAVVAFHGGLGSEVGVAVAITPRIPQLLMGFALGSTTAALFSQIAGGTFAKGADIGADVGAREAGLDDDDAENPAAVANLAGDCANGAASHHVGAFAASAVEDLAAMTMLAAVYQADTTLRSPLALLLLPLMSRAFGLIGPVFSAIVVRTDDREDPFAALVRGLLVAALLHAVGLAGVVEWLVPERRVVLLGGGAIGLTTSALIVLWVTVCTSARYRSVRDVAEASRGGPTLNVLAGVSSGVRVALPVGLVAAISLLASYGLGNATQGAIGGKLALVASLFGLVGSLSFLYAVHGMGAIVDAASGLVTMTSDVSRRDARGRLAVLEATVLAPRLAARVIGAVAALCAVVLLSSGPLSIEHQVASAVGPWIGGMFGVGLVLWISGRSIVGVFGAGRRIVEEVRRQLRDRTPPPEGAEVVRARDVDHTPCSETATRHALRQMVLAGSQSVLLIVLCIGGLHLLESEDKTLPVGGSLASLIVAATITGVLGSLLSLGAGGAWGSAKKYIVTGAHGGRLHVDETGARAENPTFVASVIGDTVGDPFKDAAVPCVMVLVRMLPIVALILLPLFQ